MIKEDWRAAVAVRIVAIWNYELLRWCSMTAYVCKGLRLGILLGWYENGTRMVHELMFASCMSTNLITSRWYTPSQNKK